MKDGSAQQRLLHPGLLQLLKKVKILIVCGNVKD